MADGVRRLGRRLRDVVAFRRRQACPPSPPAATPAGRGGAALADIVRRLDAGDRTGIVASRADAGRRPPRALERRWEEGIEAEVAYWTRYVRDTVRADAREGFRLDPTLPLAQEMAERIVVPPGREVRVLDVGAGPFTKRWEGHRLEVVAVDALAPYYDRILGEAGIDPPVRNCANALDHCYDPLRAIDEMLKVVKPGGPVLLRHFPNEAETEGYAGFHQWNLFAHGRHLIVWNRDEVLLIDAILAGVATLETIADGNLVTCCLRKL